MDLRTLAEGVDEYQLNGVIPTRHRGISQSGALCAVESGEDHTTSRAKIGETAIILSAYNNPFGKACVVKPSRVNSDPLQDKRIG